MDRLVKSTGLIAIYVTIVMAPVLVALVDPLRIERDFATELAVALGLASFGMMGMQSLLTARFRRAAAPFGTDILYYFHRYLGYLALVVVAGHAAIFVGRDPALLRGLTRASFARPLVLGVVAFFALAVLVVSSVARRAIRLEYGRWRALHAGLAVVGMAGGLAHALDYGIHTGSGWTRILWVVYGLGGALVLAYVRVLKPWRALLHPWELVEVRDEAGGVRTLVLEPLEPTRLTFQAGQFAWLDLGHSPFAMAEHPFSFASAPGALPRVEFAIQPVGDFTCGAVEAPLGTRAYVEGPHGIFTVEAHPAPRYVFIAGGIGIAPIMSILRDRASRGDQRPLLLLYATRDVDGAPFGEELESLAQRLDLRVVRIVERPPDHWRGETGRIDAPMLARYLPDPPDAARYLMCGPEGMQQSVERLLEDVGVPPDRIHTELFHWV